MRYTLLIIAILALCSANQTSSTKPAEQIADADSLLSVIYDQEDFKQERLRAWLVDSLQKFVPNSVKQKILGRGRIFRGSMLDSIRIARGVPYSRVGVFQDSSFNAIKKIVYSSEKDLSVVIETFNYQPPDRQFRRLWAVDSTSLEGYKFQDKTEMTSTLNGIKAKYYQWEKTHGTTYFVDADDGDDADDGLSEANAFATLGQAVSSVAAGDTVVDEGTFTEELSLSGVNGSSGNKIVFIDSLRYYEGVNLTNPDTVWTATIDGESTRAECIDAGTAGDYIDFIGFEFVGPTDRYVLAINANNSKFLQCKTGDFGDAAGSGFVFNNIAHTDSIISCLFLNDVQINSTSGMIILGSSTNDFYIANNTFYTQFYNPIDLNGNGPHVILNNIIHEYGPFTSSPVRLIDVQSPSSTLGSGDMDHNIWYNDDKSVDDFIFNGTSIEGHTAFEDSVNNYVTGGEANSSLEDPLLQNPLTTAYITDSSPAHNAGTDEGYGDDIGYYQVPAAPAGGEEATRPKTVKPIWWH